MVEVEKLVEVERAVPVEKVKEVPVIVEKVVSLYWGSGRDVGSLEVLPTRWYDDFSAVSTRLYPTVI